MLRKYSISQSLAHPLSCLKIQGLQIKTEATTKPSFPMWCKEWRKSLLGTVKWRKHLEAPRSEVCPNRAWYSVYRHTSPTHGPPQNQSYPSRGLFVFPSPALRRDTICLCLFALRAAFSFGILPAPLMWRAAVGARRGQGTSSRWHLLRLH